MKTGSNALNQNHKLVIFLVMVSCEGCDCGEKANQTLEMVAMCTIVRKLEFLEQFTLNREIREKTSIMKRRNLPYFNYRILTLRTTNESACLQACTYFAFWAGSNFHRSLNRATWCGTARRSTCQTIKLVCLSL